MQQTRSTESPQRLRRWRVADLEIDAVRMQVLRNGVELPLPRLSFDLLVALIEIAPSVATVDLLLDRGMMGDGVIDIPRIRGWVEAQGYAGYSEVEIFSANNWWKRDPDDVLATCGARHRECT